MSPEKPEQREKTATTNDFISRIKDLLGDVEDIVEAHAFFRLEDGTLALASRYKTDNNELLYAVQISLVDFLPDETGKDIGDYLPLKSLFYYTFETTDAESTVIRSSIITGGANNKNGNNDELGGVLIKELIEYLFKSG